MIWQFTITDSNNTNTIVDEPVGFTEMTYSVRRNLNHHGIFKSINTGSLKYVNDAFGILNTEYETNGADAKSTLKIEYKCAQNDEFTTFFEGRFDFNTFNKICGKMCYIECQVIVSSCVDTFLSSVDTNIDLDATTSLNGDAITALDSQTLYIDGQDILLINSANNNAVTTISDTNQTILTGLHNIYQSIYLPNTTSESLGTFNANGLATTLIQDGDGVLLDPNGTALGTKWTDFMQFTSILEPPATGLDCIGDYVYSFENTGQLKFTAQYNGFLEVSLQIKKYSSVTDEFTFIDGVLLANFDPFTANIPIYVSTNATLTGSIPLESTDILCYYYKYRINQTTGTALALNFTIELTTAVGNQVDIQQNSVCQLTTTKSYKLDDVFNWMPNAMNNCFDVTCNADCFPAYQLTNGLMIRNVINPVVPKLFVSWTDLFRNITKIFNVGWGFTNNDTELLIGDLVELYTNTPILDLGSIDEVKFEHAKDLTYGLINLGYSKWEAEEYSGLDEMNTTRQYKRNVTSNNSQMDLLSNFITAGYTIEITRRKNMPLTGTSDWRYDNDIFLINTDFDGTVYRAYRGVDFDPINIISPTTRMNYRLTPIRTLLNWFKSIAAPTPDFTNEELQFNSGTGNYLAHGKMLNDCSLEITPLTENETIISNYFNDEDDAKPIWKAIYASFTCPLTIADKGTIDADPYGTFTFTCNGIEHSGYLVECTYTPENGTANFKILLKNE